MIAGGDKHCKEKWRSGVWETGGGATVLHTDARRPLCRGMTTEAWRKWRHTACEYLGKRPWQRQQQVQRPWGGMRTKGFYSLGFPGGSDGKESAGSVGDLGSIPGSGRSPGGGHGNPLQYSCLENPHGQRSLAGYSTLGVKEWLSTTHNTLQAAVVEVRTCTRSHGVI